MQAASDLSVIDGYHHHYHYQSSAQYLWLGDILKLMGKHDEAATAYQKAVFQDHGNEDAIRKLAGNPIPIVPGYCSHPVLDAEFCTAIGEDKTQETRQHDRAAHLYLAGEYKKAVALLLVQPAHGNSCFLLGKCYTAMEDYAKARHALTEAIGLSHSAHNAYHCLASEHHFRRGNVFLTAGETDLAIMDFSKALDLYPGNKNALQARADAYYSKGSVRLAEADEMQIP